MNADLEPISRKDHFAYVRKKWHKAAVTNGRFEEKLMSSEIEALIAEFDEEAPGSPSTSASDELRGVSMEFDIEAEIKKRRAALQRVLSRTDPERIKTAIEAYKQDLPRLLGEDKARYVVAYDGGTRVGIARNLEELELGFKQDGIKDRSNLFIKHVSPLDDEGEHF